MNLESLPGGSSEEVQDKSMVEFHKDGARVIAFFTRECKTHFAPMAVCSNGKMYAAINAEMKGWINREVAITLKDQNGAIEVYRIPFTNLCGATDEEVVAINFFKGIAKLSADLAKMPLPAIMWSNKGGLPRYWLSRNSIG